MGHIYFIMGVSGSGKGTLISNIKKLNLENFHFPLSYRTRLIREGEINGVDSWFISKEEFFSQVQAGEFLEYAVVHGIDYYGTKYEDVIKNGIKKGKTVLKELDIIGLEELRKNHPGLDNKYTTIFLYIPEDILKQRIIKRGAFISSEELERRLKSAIVETQKAENICDFMIDSSKSEELILEEVLKIINSKKGKK